MTLHSLNEQLNQFHLLKHPFYQAWSAGELTLNDLKVYSEQYYHQVDAFPRYISTIHSKCADISSRQVLLDNLTDEEKGEKNHPELWLRFAEGVGATRESVKSASLTPETQALVDGFYALCNKSYASGLGALYAYERQVPEVAKSKIEGLNAFYGLNDVYNTEFFSVHISADEWHSQEVSDLMDKLSPAEKQEAYAAAQTASKLLWGFLDGMMTVLNKECPCVN